MREEKFSLKVREIKRSPIRELLKLVGKPGVISFAGGIPDPTLFPVKLIEETTCEILKNEFSKALQYSATEGDIGLKKEIIKRNKEKENIEINEDQILITTASQQGLDLIGKIFLDPGDIVIVELPSYLGGLMAFQSYGAQFIGIKMDADGMIIDELEYKLKNLPPKEIKKVKFIYTVPDFQNPSGVTMSLERRKKLIKLAEEYDLLIVEDSPYRELRYWRDSIPSLFSLAPDGRVIFIYTFSKVFCPGMRLGYIMASEDIIDKCVVAKQATDLCTPAFTQAILREILKKGKFDSHINRLIEVYREKREFMLNTLNKYMLPLGLKELDWTRPDGGLFLWLTLPKNFDTEEMIPKALTKGVAYVAGKGFHCDGSGKNTMRLNFSYSTFELIDKGVERLAELIKEEMKEK